MRFVLAAVVLTGLSFAAWGFAGFCRYLYDQDRQTRSRSLYLVNVSALGSGLAALVILVSHIPLVWIAERAARLAGLAPTEAAAMWWARLYLVACGGLALYAGLRFFRVERSRRALLVAAPTYALTLAVIRAGAGDAAMPLAALSGSPLALSGMAIVAAAVAVYAVGRWPGKREPAIGGEPVAGSRLRPEDVAVVICARDEQEVIGNCLDKALKIVPAGNVFVGSDGSSDRTVDIVAAAGCQVLDIQPNGGKARALAAVLAHFRITERFEAVLILDADSEVDPRYLERALPLLDDPEVVAVAGHANPKWFHHLRPRWAMFFAAYRVRLYTLTQALLRYGQTWKLFNVSFIVPGFASMYRSRVLEQIDIDAPGLSVEDFNMTFEIHRKKLGQIAYTPQVWSTSQEAHGLGDYVRQVRRWYLGFWQTVRRHGVWPSVFWLSLGTFVIEMLLASIIFLSVPLAVTWFVLEGGDPVTLWLPPTGSVDISVFEFVIAVLVADYTLTALVALAEKKPMLLVYGLGFSALRYLDAILFLYTLPLAFVEESDGRWASPQRLLSPDGPGHRILERREGD